MKNKLLILIILLGLLKPVSALSMDADTYEEAVADQKRDITASDYILDSEIENGGRKGMEAEENYEDDLGNWEDFDWENDEFWKQYGDADEYEDVYEDEETDDTEDAGD